MENIAINQLTPSTNLIGQQKSMSESQKGSLQGKKVINIDPSYVEKKTFGAGAEGMLKTLCRLVLVIAMFSSILYMAFSVIYLKIPALTFAATPLGARIMGFWVGASLATQVLGKD